MRYQTEMMKAILESEKAQEIIDYVSPIYGNSYVALWIFQAIGIVLGEVCTIAEKLRYETNPATAEILLDMWEDHYGIPRDSSLTPEQRRLRIIDKTQSRGPCNPVRLERAVSAAIGGKTVEITENTAKNTFLVNIREYATKEEVEAARAVIDRKKPAHLKCEIRVATQMIATADTKVAIALTHAENYKVEVYS